MANDIFLPGQPLTDEHRAYLVSSGIRAGYLDDPEVLIRSAVTISDLRFPPEPGQQTKPWDHLNHPVGLLFGWKNAAGDVTWQFRPDHPEEDERGRVKKYLFPCDSRTRYALRSDAGETASVWIVEGTKQAHVVASYVGDEITIIGIPGCTGWSEGEWVPPADLVRLVRRRDVLILLDADAATNPDVYHAGEELLAALNASAKSVKFIPCPGKGSQGIDDYTAIFDEDERSDVLRDLEKTSINKPAKRKPAERTRRERSLLERAAHQDALEKERAEAADAALNAFGMGADADEEDLRKARRGDGSLWLRDTGGLAVATLGSAVLESDTPVATTAPGVIAVYTKAGVYVAQDKALNAVATALMGNHYSSANESTLCHWLDGTCTREGKVLPVGQTGRPYVNFKNGMLNIDTLELHPHDPSYLSTRQVPFDWNPDAKCPVYDAWLVDRVGEKQVAVLEEVASQFLDESRPPAKALFMFGPSRSGKGTFTRIAEDLIGGDDSGLISAITLHQLSDDRFAAAELYGKALTVAADLSKRHINDLSVFKMALGQDPIQGNKKFGAMFTFKNTSLFWMSANTIPTVGEESNAYVNRIVPVSFPKTYEGKEDAAIQDAILEELPGIAVRWVKARQAHRARRHRWLQVHPAVSSAFGQGSDRVARFVADCCVVGQELPEHEYRREGTSYDGTDGWVVGSYAPITELHRAFKSWASDEGAGGMSRETLRRRLELQPGYRQLAHPVKSGGMVTNLAIKPRNEWGDANTDSAGDLIRVLFPQESADVPVREATACNVVPISERKPRRNRSLFHSTRPQMQEEMK